MSIEKDNSRFEDIPARIRIRSSVDRKIWLAESKLNAILFLSSGIILLGIIPFAHGFKPSLFLAIYGVLLFSAGCGFAIKVKNHKRNE